MFHLIFVKLRVYKYTKLVYFPEKSLTQRSDLYNISRILLIYEIRRKETLSRVSPLPFITLCLIYNLISLVKITIFSALIAAFNDIPVNDTPELFELLATAILIIEIVGVLPHIKCEQRMQA